MHSQWPPTWNLLLNLHIRTVSTSLDDEDRKVGPLAQPRRGGETRQTATDNHKVKALADDVGDVAGDTPLEKGAGEVVVGVVLCGTLLVVIFRVERRTSDGMNWLDIRVRTAGATCAAPTALPESEDRSS